jgi:FkbM family methyltransferase
MKKIFIEVGANEGTNTEQFVQEDSILYCFEPVFELYIKLWDKYKNNKNVLVLPFAIDLDNSIKKFNVSNIFNKGCSSLNDFNPNIENIWPGRPDFRFDDSYFVPTITLYDFINLYKIDYIDFLWIDAQGHDFNVIKSLKDKISIVKEGRCEAAYNISLYDGVDNNFNNIINYLDDKGFNCSIETDYSGIEAECDIIFKKK